MAEEAWIGNEELSDLGNDRLRRFIKEFNEHHLIARASELKGREPCTLSEKFSLGTFNYVRKISFVDGTAWVARVRMPPFDPEEEGSFRNSAYNEIAAEVAAMEFVRFVLHVLIQILHKLMSDSENTSIPVPKVFDLNADRDGSVGFPYLLMEFIDANSAEEVAAKHGACKGKLPEDYELHFWTQLAGIMVELASIRAPMIGSVAAGSTTSHIQLTSFPDSKSGPYESTKEFYDDVPLALAHQLREPPTDGQAEYIDTFRAFAARNFSHEPESEQKMGFGLVHYDLGPCNVLVDDEFNVKAVIDWDALFSLPRAGLHFLPKLMDMDCMPPGVFPRYMTHEEFMPRALAFSRVVEQVSRERSVDHAGSQPVMTSAEFFKPEAIAFRLLETVKYRQDFVNHYGITCLNWMDSHSQGDIEQYLDIQGKIG